MTYDLFVLPVDRPLTAAETAAELERLQRSLGFGLGHDKRLDPFIAEMGRKYWQLRTRTPIPPPFEFDVARSYVLVGIPWSKVDEVVRAVADAAFGSGVAVWDPQRETVGLPEPFGEAPLGVEGTEEHVRRASEALAAVGRGVLMATPMDPDDAPRAVNQEVRAAGYTAWSPLGFEITPELEADVAADPTRMPRSLQTPTRREELVARLATPNAPDRHLAIAQLAGWDPDPLVGAALRPLVASEDVYESTTAAAGLARQQDVTDLPALVELVFRLSPADGASQATMVAPLRAALDLAALAGPEIVEGVRRRAGEWRVAGGRRPAWDRDFDAVLDELLGS